jgi:glycosyltransferase involved in cell wall biosynthesis
VTRVRRLLTVGHSYVVALNRRLPHELARAGAGRWEVTVATPTFVHGDLRPIPLECFPDEASRLTPVPAYLTRRPHVMFYGRTLRLLLREPWDVVHCWEEPFVAAGGQLARWAESTRLVYYTFQNLPKRYPPPFSWLERYAVRKAAGWIAAGHAVKQALEPRLNYADKPHRIIPLGVDIDIYRPSDAGRELKRSLERAENGPPIVGYLGRFVPEKGIHVLTAALDAQLTPWRALFVGGGKLEDELRQWAAKYSDKRVRIVTGVPHDAVPRYLNAMDVLAAPSQTTARWKEQFGRMLVEAMSCGVPVIGSDSGEIPFVIGKAGEVVGEADLPGWTRSIASLLESPARRVELATRGRERAEEVYAWPVIAREHLDFFEQLVK